MTPQTPQVKKLRAVLREVASLLDGHPDGADLIEALYIIRKALEKP